MSMITVKHRPLERFWPYADLPEQPTDEELASLDPDLHEALFGPTPHPFSITLVFPALDMPEFERALDLARGAAEFRETGSGASHRYRARFLVVPTRSGCARCFEIVGRADATEVLIDDRPVPYARAAVAAARLVFHAAVADSWRPARSNAI